MNGEKREAPVPSPERPRSVETGREMERAPERQAAARAETSAAEQAPAAPSSSAASAAAEAAVKDAHLMKVERVLEENLGDIYFSLPADRRALFKAKGEETAVKIRTMIESSKVAARKVLDLIRAWLKLIPGVNRYFLEQEAKIKTDKVMLVAEDIRKQKELQV